MKKASIWVVCEWCQVDYGWKLPNRIVERFKLVADALWSTNWPIYEILMFSQSRALRNGGLLQFLLSSVAVAFQLKSPLLHYSISCPDFPETNSSRREHLKVELPPRKIQISDPISDKESEPRSSPLGRAVNYGRRFIQIKVGSHRAPNKRLSEIFPGRGQRYTPRWKFRIIKVENLHIFEII